MPEFFLWFLAGVSWYIGLLTGFILAMAVMYWLKPCK